ncbi:envelope stress sensor histidine kinase CpxA [Gallibacterium trehalosifermentans]|uniref:histidine kinase n=1 Tax=Gallibacterium trehalosifermentans TaxID=516935 RepID=A0ABV6H108_9PAST
MKRKLFKPFSTLTGQIYLFFILIFCISFIIAIILPSFDSRNYSTLQEQEVNIYNNIIFSMIEKMDDSNSFHLQSQIEALAKEKHLRFALVNQAGKIMSVNYQDYTNLKEFIIHSDNPLFPQKKQFDTSEIIGPFLIKLSYEGEKSTTYYSYFIKKVPPTHPVIKVFFDKPLIMLLIISIITAPLLLILSYKITAPIARLRKAVNNVAMGNFIINKALEKKGPVEIQAVGKSFNQMVTALEDLLNAQNRMLSDISHELRTPLARLKLSAAIIRRRHGETPELARIELEAERLEQMISDILNISRQQINNQLEREIFPIPDIWEDVIEDTKFEIELLNKEEDTQKQLIIENNIKNPYSYFINGNSSSLSGALENIIQNAKKYGNEIIKISISINQDELIICIEDDGNGIDPSEYHKIFAPFYRVDTARTRESGGFGLGLAIVANTIKQHQGTILAHHSELGGLLVKIHLPLWSD